MYINKSKSQALYLQAGLQLPYGFKMLGFDTIIHKSHNVVNTQSMQNSEKNTQKAYLPLDIQKTEQEAQAERAAQEAQTAQEAAENEGETEAGTERQKPPVMRYA